MTVLKGVEINLLDRGHVEDGREALALETWEEEEEEEEEEERCNFLAYAICTSGLTFCFQPPAATYWRYRCRSKVIPKFCL